MEVGVKWEGVTEKFCEGCEEYRAVENFFWKPSPISGKHYPSSRCKECDQKHRSAYMKERRENQEYRIREIAKAKGISSYEYLSQLERQNGMCAICGATENLEVDHDHACCSGPGRTCGSCNRGFLCRRCNRLLGMAQDSPTLLMNALNYISEKGTWERFTNN